MRFALIQSALITSLTLVVSGVTLKPKGPQPTRTDGQCPPGEAVWSDAAGPGAGSGDGKGNGNFSAISRGVSPASLVQERGSASIAAYRKKVLLEGVFYRDPATEGHCCDKSRCVLGPCMPIQSAADCRAVLPLLRDSAVPEIVGKGVSTETGETGCFVKGVSTEKEDEGTQKMLLWITGDKDIGGDVCGCYGEISECPDESHVWNTKSERCHGMPHMRFVPTKCCKSEGVAGYGGGTMKNSGDRECPDGDYTWNIKGDQRCHGENMRFVKTECCKANGFYRECPEPKAKYEWDFKSKRCRRVEDGQWTNTVCCEDDGFISSECDDDADGYVTDGEHCRYRAGGEPAKKECCKKSCESHDSYEYKSLGNGKVRCQKHNEDADPKCCCDDKEPGYAWNTKANRCQGQSGKFRRTACCLARGLIN